MKEHPTSGQGRQVTGFGHTASPGWQEGPSHTQAPEPAPGKLAFVLSGGGSLGSVQVGCIQALLQHGVFPDLVVGTSVGALNGVWLAKDPTPDWVENLKELWLSMGRHGPFRTSRMRVTLRLLMGREYLYANDFLRKLVCQYIGDTTFEDLQVPAVIVATNMETGEPAVLDRGSLELAVLASTAIAGVFPPVQIDGVEYVDGGMMSYCGLGPAWDHGARRMVVIEAPHPPPERGVGIFKPLGRALQVALVWLCHLEVESLSQRCPVVALHPEVPLKGHTFDDFSKTPLLIEGGKAWTESYLQSNQGELLRSFTRSGE